MADELLHNSHGARVTRDGNGCVCICSERRLLYALLFLATAIVLSPFAVALPVLAATETVRGQQPNLLALTCFGLFALMVLALVVLSVLATLVFAFPRRCEIYPARGIATFRHYPGYNQSVPLAEIKSVDIILVASKGGNGCFLGVSQNGSDRIRWIHTIASRSASQGELRDRMRPLAEIIAGILNRPIESSVGAARWLDTVKKVRLDD